MSKQEFLELFISDRIDMILKKIKRNVTEEEIEKIDETEDIIDKLPEYEKSMIRSHIDGLINLHASEEKILYEYGLKDGLKIWGIFHDIV